jgi:hypothetical protein
MMMPAVYILLALLSLALSILCFGNLLISCSGHPAITAVGIWIIPLSLFGGAVFLYLSIFLWKARHREASGHLKKEGRLLPKKVIVFITSFAVAAIVYFLLMLAILALALNAAVRDWIGYVLYPLFALISIYVGVTVYRKLVRIGV